MLAPIVIGGYGVGDGLSTINVGGGVRFKGELAKSGLKAGSSRRSEWKFKNKKKSKGKGNGNGKSNSRSPARMTERKATASAKAS
jgi:hypothetical protein